MSKIQVITDSSADITENEAAALGLKVVRMPISLDGVEYTEGIDIDRETFIQKMRDGAVAKTSQATLGWVKKIWDEALKEADEVIYIPISSGLSGSYASAAMLAENEYEGKVTVLDVKHACHPVQVVCKQVQKAIDQGMKPAEIKKLFEEKAELWAALIPENLEYLRRGGRISAAAAALGGLLKILPILKVEDGKIDVLDKVRTSKKAYQVAMEACFVNIENKEDYEWLIVEADAMETALKLKDEVEEKYGVTVTIVPMHPIIMSHTGPGTIGFGHVYKVIK